MHHSFLVSFFDMATLRMRRYSRTSVLEICASFRASSLIGSRDAGTVVGQVAVKRLLRAMEA